VSLETTTRRNVPKQVWKLPLGQRIRWARTSSKLSHDRLVQALGRSNRGHLIKVERGLHIPREDLRDAIADATNVPRELFADADSEESRAVSLDDILRRRVREIYHEELAAILASTGT
jgi:transcriptional regulator with XRE-family HTH domain